MSSPSEEGAMASKAPTLLNTSDGEHSEKSKQISEIGDQGGEKIAETVRKFLSLCGVEQRDGADIVFEQLCVEGAGTGTAAAPTVTSSAKSVFGVLNPILNRFKTPPSRRILHNFQGSLEAGEMLLVIGKPGSGCTTFLKSLANMHDEYKEVTGDLTYGGLPAADMASNFSKDIVFCAEEDDHFPSLTVAETLRFALRARSGPKVSGKELEDAVRCLAQLVGLDGVLNTKVGNDYTRGVSGGERRRTSLAEAIATCARVLLFDNPTYGLDSSTAVEFIEMISEVTRQSRAVTAMSIYQGSDAILPYFSKVAVINNGRQIYYGKLSEARAYFQNLGFECLPSTTTTDFLNSMSADRDARRVVEGMASRVPRTPEDFERTFANTQHHDELRLGIEAARQDQSLVGKKPEASYALPLYYQIWQCAFRHFKILIKDTGTWAMEAACIIVQSLVLGTLFRDQARATQSFFILASSLFYSVLVPALQAMSEFGNTFTQRPLILKHKRYSLYRPAAYAFGLVLTDSAWKIIAIAYNIPLYFLTGFQYTAGNFFIWFFVVYIEHLALSMFFRSVAIFSPNMNRAVLPVGIFFNMYVLYTGLYVPPPQMQIWLGWLRYLNPLYYGFESVMLNEFSSLTYTCSASDLAPSGPGYDSIANQVCAVVGAEPGQGTVSGLAYLTAQYGFEASHKWRNVGINAALFVAFAFLTGVGMERLKVPAGRLATVFYNHGQVRSSASTDELDKEMGDVADDTPPAVQEAAVRRHQSRPHEETHHFNWQNLNLVIDTKEGKRQILTNLNGTGQGSRMKALCGVSGAGKTTLLNVLAGRNDIGTLTGELNLNGAALPKSFSRYMGFAAQQDVHLPTQTIREAVRMTATLRRPKDIPLEEKHAYVEEVLEWLELTDIAEALIGVPGAGLNLEQRKRVTVAVEMAAKPEILFLDEPTSGLDGQSAASIIRLLRKLADSGQAIICTIHQPAAELISTFDELYLLAKGGKLVYDGPLGEQCSEAIKYFEQHANRPCGKKENPAEYFLEVVGAGSRNKNDIDWPQLWQEHAKELRSNEKTNIAGPSSSFVKQNDSTYAVPWATQLQVVLSRAWLFYWREPDYFNSKLWMNVGNSLLNSLTYLNSPLTQRGIYNRVFSAFMSLIVGPPLGLQVEPRFVMLRDIFMLREKASLTYHWSIFVVSAIIIELPYAFITSFVYWILWYFPVGYITEPNRSGYSFLMYELFAIFATSLAQLCATIMPNLGATFAANGFFFMFCNTFAGTLSPKPVTPSGWSWYYNVSPLFYLGEGVTVDVLQDLPINCTGDEVSIFNPPSGQTCSSYAANFLKSATGYLLNPDSTSACEYCRYKDGQAYYTQYGYEWMNRYRNIGVFIAFIAFNYTAVIAVTYLIRIKKWKKN